MSTEIFVGGGPATALVTRDVVTTILKEALTNPTQDWISHLEPSYTRPSPFSELTSVIDDTDFLLSTFPLTLVGLSGDRFKLTLPRFLLGLQTALPHAHHIVSDDGTIFTDMIDSNLADFVLQLAIFNGQLIFE